MASINLYEGIEQSEPAGFYKHFAWVKAFEDWKKGYPETLAELMNDYVGDYLAPVPKEMAHLLTAIITGQVKPERRGRSNVKLTKERNYKGEVIGEHQMKPSEILDLMLKLETKIKLSKFLSGGQELDNLKEKIAEAERKCKPEKPLRDYVKGLDIFTKTLKKYEDKRKKNDSGLDHDPDELIETALETAISLVLHHSYDKLAVKIRKQLATKKGVEMVTVKKWEDYFRDLKNNWPNIWGF